MQSVISFLFLLFDLHIFQKLKKSQHLYRWCFLIWLFIELCVLFLITHRYRWAESHGERDANENIHVVDKISQTAEEKGQARL